MGIGSIARLKHAKKSRHKAEGMKNGFMAAFLSLFI